MYDWPTTGLVLTYDSEENKNKKMSPLEKVCQSNYRYIPINWPSVT